MFLKSYKGLYSELVKSKELIVRLFIRDFLARTKQSVLGVLWIVLMPFFLIAGVFFMNKGGILNVGDIKVPYSIFSILGITIWQLFSQGVLNATNSLVSSGKMIMKINFPKEVLVISSIAQSIFDFLVRFFIVILTFIFYNYVPSWKIIFFPILLIPLIFLTIGLGFIFSLFHCIVRDTLYIVTFFITILLFFTPVLYEIPKSGVFYKVIKFNILFYLVSAPRDVVIYGRIQNLEGYLYSVLISIFLFFFSWRVFHLSEYRMAQIV